MSWIWDFELWLWHWQISTQDCIFFLFFSSVLWIQYKWEFLQSFERQQHFSEDASSYLKVWSRWSEVAQSCPTLCNPMDCSLPGSTIHGIFQARILEWVAISFSRRSSRPRDWTWVSHMVGIIGRRFTIWATRENPVWKSIIRQLFCSFTWVIALYQFNPLW